MPVGPVGPPPSSSSACRVMQEPATSKVPAKERNL